MKRGSVVKSKWVMVLLMLAGIVIGGFIGTLLDGYEAFNWLNYGQAFGLDSPIVLDLGILVLTFGLSIKVTIASIVGMAISLIIYRFL